MAYALEDEFGDIIGKARRGQNMSHSQIATAAGVTEADLARMEQYTLKPTESQVFRLAEVLNLDGAKLLDIATEQWAPEPAQQASDANLGVVTISRARWRLARQRLSFGMQSYRCRCNY